MDMIEVGRRGLITALAAPAVIRVAPLMPISTRFTPLYVPINWLADDVLFQRYGMAPFPVEGQRYGELTDEAVGRLIDEITGLKNFKQHAWPRPLSENWVNINDLDPGYVRQWANRIDLESEMKFTSHQSWWDQDERASITRPEPDS
jgi:hypothetical protein